MLLTLENTEKTKLNFQFKIIKLVNLVLKWFHLRKNTLRKLCIKICEV